MKRISSLLLCVLIAITATAHDIELDGIYYNLNTETKEAIVTYKGNWSSSYSDEYSGHVAIPTTITIDGDTYFVITIGSDAFHGCSRLTSVAIPNSVTVIEGSAFYGCSSLTAINLPYSVSKIGNYAFENCTSLEEVYADCCVDLSKVLPGMTLYSSREHFVNVVKANPNQKVLVPEGDDMLVPVRIDRPNNEAYVRINGIVGEYTLVGLKDNTVAYEFDTDQVMLYLNGISQSAEIVKYGSIITTLAPSEMHKDNVLDVADCAFAPEEMLVIRVANPGDLVNMIDLKKMDGYKKLTVRGDLNGTDILAIRRMRNLVSLNMDGANIVNGGMSYYEQYTTSQDTFGDYILNSQPKLTEILLPSSIKTIGRNALKDCTSLISISIPNNVTNIESGAFQGCSRIHGVTLGTGVESINKSAFSNCSRLTYLSIKCQKWISKNHTSETNVSIFGKQLKEVWVYSPVTSIGSSAFGSCSGIENIYIDRSITSIGAGAFGGCVSLRRVNVPEGVTKIGNSTFSDCYSLSVLYLSPNITSIGDHAFSGCKALTKLDLPYGLVSIGSWAFSGLGVSYLVIPHTVKTMGEMCCYANSALVSVSTGDGLEEIPHAAFDQCTNLTNVYLGKGLKRINDMAFISCQKLENITVPDNVEYIGYHVFEDCYDLGQITIGAGVRTIENDSFYRCYRLKKVNIHDLSAWCQIKYGNEVSNPLMYAGRLYLNDVEIKDLVIPSDVTSISRRAFYYCSGLKSVVMPDNVLSIGSDAFANCTGLESVTLSNNLKEIPSMAFCNCDNLKTVIIGRGTETICSTAFSFDPFISLIVCKNPIPPYVESSDEFKSIDYSNCWLEVPEESIPLYWIHPTWEKFFNIRGLSTTGFNNITSAFSKDAPPLLYQSPICDFNGRSVISSSSNKMVIMKRSNKTIKAVVK